MGRRKLPVNAGGFLSAIRKPENTVVLFLRKFRVVILLIFAAIFGGFFWWRWASGPVTTQEKREKVFIVKKGEDLSSIAARLDKEGLVKSALAFKIIVLSSGWADRIQAGSFRLRSSMDGRETAFTLTKGTVDIWLTFPEGWRKEEFARRLSANLKNFSEEDFLLLVKDLEGYLFPDTYLFPQQASPSAVVKIFTNNFEKKFSGELEAEAGEKGLTKRQVLILASIVERETKYEKDRPVVAGILIKRWQKNWPLQADATTQYAVAEQEDWWPKITKTDLEIDSPYNTYKYKGLPPAPICNPGLASIKAVIYPQETSYWYYLSDREGKIHYSQTFEEHNQNIAKYLR